MKNIYTAVIYSNSSILPGYYCSGTMTANAAEPFDEEVEYEEDVEYEVDEDDGLIEDEIDVEDDIDDVNEVDAEGEGMCLVSNKTSAVGYRSFPWLASTYV